MTPSYILVVDDDRRLRELITRFLKDHQFHCHAAANAAEARAHMATNHFDLIILDIMMPGETGIELAQSLRTTGHTIPLLMLTAKDQMRECIDGFDSGADDYMTKPFEPIELLARIKAILRRTTPRQKPLTTPSLRLGDYSFSESNGLLRQDGEPIYLTSTELALLKTLALTPRQALSREELAQRIGHRVSDRTVDVQITRLRRKIGDDPRHPRYLQTIRHIGYALHPDG